MSCAVGLHMYGELGRMTSMLPSYLIFNYLKAPFETREDPTSQLHREDLWLWKGML